MPFKLKVKSKKLKVKSKKGKGNFIGGESGIAVNLSIVLLQKRLEEVSPPFQGGVAGIVDYLMFTKLISRPGWLICLSGRLFFLKSFLSHFSNSGSRNTNLFSNLSTVNPKRSSLLSLFS